MVVIPTAYIVLASLNTDLGVAEGQFWPSSFSLASYSKIWTTANLGTGLLNSIVWPGSWRLPRRCSAP